MNKLQSVPILYSGRAAYSDLNPRDGPTPLLNCNLVYNELKFRPYLEYSDLFRSLYSARSRYSQFYITSGKAGQHVLLVQGQGGQGHVTFRFLETSVLVQPL